VRSKVSLTPQIVSCELVVTFHEIDEDNRTETCCPFEIFHALEVKFQVAPILYSPQVIVISAGELIHETVIGLEIYDVLSVASFTS
jgi:hypothetical protein